MVTAATKTNDNRRTHPIVDRRQLERREPKRGVNVRHDDRDDYKPKRVRRAETMHVYPVKLWTEGEGD